MPRRSSAAGFTLLELLVALAIFALLAAMAYGGLRSVLEARASSDAAAARLARLQSTLLMLERDLSQAVDRGVRDAYGDPQPALVGDDGGLELTRGGYLNPLGGPRSDLQRVAWRLRDGALERADWKVLDRAQDSTPYTAPLLRNVRALHLRFLDARHRWQPSWPPPADGRTAAAGLPLAVEVTLELKDWGTLVRLLPLPGTAPPPATGNHNG